MDITNAPYTVVTLWVGELSAARCVADRFDGDVLTVTSIDTDAVVREIPAGDWIDATTFDATGHPVYAIRATTPTRKLVTL